jgi:hypothetical protein
MRRAFPSFASVAPPAARSGAAQARASVARAAPTAWPAWRAWTGSIAMLAACAPTLDWREVRPAAGVVALFPCKPRAATREITLGGQVVPLALHACSAGGLTWAVAVADVRDPARVGRTLDELRTSAATNLGAAGAQPLPLQVPGATPNPSAAREALDGRAPDGRALAGQVAVFARGTLVVQATVLGPALPAEAVDAFFGGLRAQ